MGHNKRLNGKVRKNYPEIRDPCGALYGDVLHLRYQMKLDFLIYSMRKFKLLPQLKIETSQPA